MRGIKRRSVALLAVALACGTTFAACGETGRGETAGAAAKPAADAVTIGLIVPTDTPSTNQPGAIGGAKAAAEAVNEQGGIDGHDVEIVYCNDKGDPNESTKCAREMVDDGAVAVVGGAALNDKLIAPILARAGIPMVGWDAYFTYDAPNAYLYSGGAFFSNQWSTAYAMHKGYDMSLAWSDNATGSGLREILNGVAERSGRGFVNDVPVPPTASDFGTYVAAAQQDDANAVMVFLGLQQGAQLIKAAEAAGDTFDAYFKSGPDPTFVRAIGSAADKLYSASAFPPANSDKLAQFRKEMEAEEKRGEKYAAPDYYNEASISPWLAVHTIARLLDGDSELTARALTDALDSARDIDMMGIIPPWTPTAPGPSKAFSRVSNTALYLISYAGGTPKLETETPVPLDDVIARGI